MGHHTPRFFLSALALCFCLPVSAQASTEDATTESRVEAANLTLIEGTGGVTQAVFVIKLKYTPAGSQDYVEYELLPRTATPGVDYETLPAGRLDFAAGEIQKTLTVNVVADDRPECPEGFVLRLQHWFHGKPMDVTATIVDDDGVDGGGLPQACPDPLVTAGPPDPLDAGTGTVPTSNPPTPSKGSGCSLSQGATSSGWLLAMLGLLAILPRRRNRHAHRRRASLARGHVLSSHPDAPGRRPRPRRRACARGRLAG